MKYLTLKILHESVASYKYGYIQLQLLDGKNRIKVINL